MQRLQPWLEALRGLRDNPLADGRWLPPGRVSLPRLLIAVAAIGVAAGWYHQRMLEQHATRWIYTYRDELADSDLQALIFALLLGYLLWLLPAVYGFALNALSALQPSRGRLRLADLASAPLTDRALIAGMLAAIAPPLLWRVLAGAALLQGIVLLLHLHRGWWSVGPPALFLLRIVGGTLLGALSAALAVLILGLFYLTLSRGPRVSAWHAAGAVALALAHALWLAASLGLSVQRPWAGDLSGGSALAFGSMLALALVIIAGVLRLSRPLPWLRTLLAVGAPALGLLGPYLINGIAGSFDPTSIGMGTPIAQLAMGYVAGWGALLAVNPLSVSTPLYVDYFAYYELELGNPRAFGDAAARYTLLLVFQLALLTMLAGQARDAVARWRVGDV